MYNRSHTVCEHKFDVMIENEELKQELEMIDCANEHLKNGDNNDYWNGVIAGLRWHTYGDEIPGMDD